MSNPVLLRTYPDRLHAELASSFLESEGIESFVSSPSNLPGSYLIAEWGDGMIPHELKVAEEDLAAAQALLAETEMGLNDDEWDDESAPATEAAPTTEAPPSTDAVPSAEHAQYEQAFGVVNCMACQRPQDQDDPFFTTLRWIIGAAAAAYVLIIIAFTLLENTVIGILLGPLLFGGLLIARGYFVRHRCGNCGHYRKARR